MDFKWLMIFLLTVNIPIYVYIAYSDGKKYEAMQACYQAGHTVEDCNKIK